MTAATIHGTGHLFVTLLAVCLLAFVVYLVRRRGLGVKYSMLWIATAIGMTLVAAVPSLLDTTADALGIGYAPALLFLLAILFLMAVCMHLSYEVSRLEERTRVLAERLAVSEPLAPLGPDGADGANRADGADGAEVTQTP